MRSSTTVQRAAEQQLRDPASVLAASTFSAGLRLLPPGLHADAAKLYCLLRSIDDLVDDHHRHAGDRVAALEEWARGERPSSPETVALAELAQRYPLGREPFLDFCRGMRQDLDGEIIESESDLDVYCYRVAGTVGIMLAHVFGTSAPDAEPKMALLGAAMQRTNILRDIDEDLENGRVYVARETIRRFGFPAPGAREELLRDQIARADALYEAGWGAIKLLRHGARAMGLSTTLYREILRQIEREGFGRTAGRVSVPRWRKNLILARYGAAGVP
jgi:15-cis-phytoene synthase